jgi:flavin-dependent dehydrogenase
VKRSNARKASWKNRGHHRIGAHQAEYILKTSVYDALIVGAGAAGCAAAMRLPAGARALVIDRGSTEHGRCCGGLLAPDAQRALAQLDLALPERVLVAPQLRAVHARDIESRSEQTYPRNYVNVDRARFDSWLVDVASRRAKVRPHTRLINLDLDDRRQCVSAVVSSGGREERIDARVVIGADGAGSRVRKLAFPHRPGPHLAIAIQACVEGPMRSAAHEVVFARSLTDFYAWAIPKESGVLIGSAFGNTRGARGRFETVLTVMRRSLGLEGPELSRSARMLSRPSRARDLFAGEGRVLLAGEAAGLVSPSSGEGLSFAFLSGAFAGEALGGNPPARDYARRFASLARAIRRKFLKARVIFSPRLRRLAMLLPWCP